MNYKLTKQLKNHPKYFIHVGGFVFKVINPKKDLIIANEIDNGTIYVTIDGKRKNLLYLMIENFLPNVTQNQTFNYSIHDGDKIPLNSIKITDFGESISDLQAETIHKFNCKQRADNANQRSRHILTALQVAESLILHDFKCVYCTTELNIKNWHLDHYVPLSKKGLNLFYNIVPSCNICNIMKGSLLPQKFYENCKTITENFRFKSSKYMDI